MKKNITPDWKQAGFKSLLEWRVNGYISRLRRRLQSFVYEGEKLRYFLRRNYLPDFIIERKDGRKLYIEVKGYLRPTDRTKLLAVRDNNPEIDLRIIFEKDNKLNSKSKTRYSEWATKNGFRWAIGELPKDWLDD